MNKIILKNIPNQIINVTFDSINYKIRFKLTEIQYIYDVSIDNKLVISSVPLCSGCPLIVYDYLVKSGNFIFKNNTGNDDFDYKEFNSSQNLFYLTDSEMKEYSKDGIIR